MLEELWNLINTKIGLVAITGITTTTLNIIYNKWHIKKEQKVRYEDVIGKKIAESLLAVRDIELESNVQEIYDIENELLKEESFNMFERHGIYPAIMNTPETFNDFLNKIINARTQYDKYLDHKIASYLFYIDRYCFTLIRYIKDNQLLDYPTAGTIFIFDIQTWQKSFDKEITKRINHPKFKLYTRYGFLWERSKKKIMKKFWERSFLKGLVENVDNPKFRMANAMLYGADNIEEIKRESQEYSRKHWIKRIFKRL